MTLALASGSVPGIPDPFSLGALGICSFRACSREKPFPADTLGSTWREIDTLAAAPTGNRLGNAFRGRIIRYNSQATKILSVIKTSNVILRTIDTFRYTF